MDRIKELRGSIRFEGTPTRFLTDYIKPRYVAGTIVALACIAVTLALGANMDAFKDRMNDDLMTDWRAQMHVVLNDPRQRQPEQKFYERVKAVGAGSRIEIKNHIDLTHYPINVTNGPGGRIIGKVPAGNTIYNVVLDEQGQWAAAKCSDIQGLLPIPEDRVMPEACALSWLSVYDSNSLPS